MPWRLTGRYVWSHSGTAPSFFSRRRLGWQFTVHLLSNLYTPCIKHPFPVPWCKPILLFLCFSLVTGKTVLYSVESQDLTWHLIAVCKFVLHAWLCYLLNCGHESESSYTDCHVQARFTSLVMLFIDLWSWIRGWCHKNYQDVCCTWP